MRSDIAHFVPTCESCRKKDPSEQSSRFWKTPASGLFPIWSNDFAGLLKDTENGNKFLSMAGEHI